MDTAENVENTTQGFQDDESYDGDDHMPEQSEELHGTEVDQVENVEHGLRQQESKFHTFY